MKLTFVDAGVLIAVARGGSEQAARALEILDDPDRESTASLFLRLEVLPQALFNKRDAEVAFYEAFFSAVSKWAANGGRPPRGLDLWSRGDRRPPRGRRRFDGRRVSDDREAVTLDSPRSRRKGLDHPSRGYVGGIAAPGVIGGIAAPGVRS